MPLWHISQDSLCYSDPVLVKIANLLDAGVVNVGWAWKDAQLYAVEKLKATQA